MSAMPGVLIDELLRTKFRETETQRDFDAARVDGWLVWDDDGTVSYVEADQFETDFERSRENN
jgi:hypothetical protein